MPDDSDKVIKVLKLEVIFHDLIRWSFAKVGDPESEIHGYQQFELSPMQDRIIHLLIEQLQFLTNRDAITVNTQSDAIKILRSLVKLLGEHLYMVLFIGKIREHLTNAVDDRTVKLLRVELEFEDEAFTSWPWEYLYKPNEKFSGKGVFLAKVAQLVLNRKLSLDRQPHNLTTSNSTPPMILLVVSKPEGLEVQCDLLLRQMRGLEQDGVIKLDLLEESIGKVPDQVGPKISRVTWQEYQARILSNPDIIHFIGHGRRTAEGGEVAFVQEDGTPGWVRDEVFAEETAKSNALKLVFLQACESALPDPYTGVSGMALYLARAYIPAVVAMQYKIENQIANTFACGFYRALVEGASVDLAVKAGREAIKNDDLEYHAFGLPVLYLSSYESIIVRERNPPPPDSSNQCPNCRKVVSARGRYCGGCGLSFFCIYPDCKKKLSDPLNERCDNCGRLLKCRFCKKEGEVAQLELDAQNNANCMDCGRPAKSIPSEMQVEGFDRNAKPVEVEVLTSVALLNTAQRSLH